MSLKDPKGSLGEAKYAFGLGNKGEYKVIVGHLTVRLYSDTQELFYFYHRDILSPYDVEYDHKFDNFWLAWGHFQRLKAYVEQKGRESNEQSHTTQVWVRN